MADLKKWLIVIAVLAVGVVAAGSLVNQGANQVMVQKQDLLDKTAAIDSLPDLKEDFEKSVSIFSDLEKSLAAKEDLADLPKDWEKLAKISNVSFVFDFGGGMPPAGLDPGFSEFHLAVSGSYNNIVKFLKSAAVSDYFVRFADLEVKEGNREFEASVNGQVFYR